LLLGVHAGAFGFRGGVHAGAFGFRGVHEGALGFRAIAILTSRYIYILTDRYGTAIHNK
jgi:hypothetical protein